VTSATYRPVALHLRTGVIPDEIKAIGRWVVWRYELRDGKWTKPPFQAATDQRASHSDPATWSPFNTATAAYAAGGYDGIGLVLTDEDDLCAVDLDHVIEPDSGVIEPWRSTSCSCWTPTPNALRPGAGFASSLVVDSRADGASGVRSRCTRPPAT
jgi:hypothetical protein